MRPHQVPGSVCAFEPSMPGDPDRFAARPGFAWMVLPRFGRRPLAVQGRALLTANNRCAGLPCWSELVILETASSRFAATLRHHAVSELPWCDAWLCATADEVRTIFRSHDPLWALPQIAGAVEDSPLCSMSMDLKLYGEPADAQRFRRAWSGLLAAVFGLPHNGRPA